MSDEDDPASQRGWTNEDGYSMPLSFISICLGTSGAQKHIDRDGLVKDVLMASVGSSKSLPYAHQYQKYYVRQFRKNRLLSQAFEYPQSHNSVINVQRV